MIECGRAFPFMCRRSRSSRGFASLLYSMPGIHDTLGLFVYASPSPPPRRLIQTLTELGVALILSLAFQGHLQIRATHHGAPTPLDRMSQRRIRWLRIPPTKMKMVSLNS